MRRLVIVGEGPNKTYQDIGTTHPLFGNPCKVMATCAGWAPRPTKQTSGAKHDVLCYKEVYRRAVLLNLCVGGWNADEARVKAVSILAAYPRHVYVLLGRLVARSFGCKAGFFIEHDSCGIGAREGGGKQEPHDKYLDHVVVPHPSGLNRIYNDPAARRSLGKALRWGYDAGRGLGLG